MPRPAAGATPISMTESPPTRRSCKVVFRATTSSKRATTSLPVTHLDRGDAGAGPRTNVQLMTKGNLIYEHDITDEEMHAALDVNIPNYASATLSTAEIVESLASL